MKKIIFLLLLLVVGCSCGGPKDGLAPVSDLDDVDELVFDEPETFDLDGDGVVDKWVYSYESEEVVEDIFLVKSLEYTEDGSFLDGVVVLEFENKGDSTFFDYELVMPDSFASKKEDIVFDIQPDSIIKGSYKARWSKLSITDTIKMRVKVRDKIDVWGNRILSKTEDLTGWNLNKFKGGLSAWITSANKADFDHKSKLSKIARIENSEEMESKFVYEALKNPSSFTLDECEALDKNADFGLRYAACRAVVSGKWGECHDHVIENWDTVDRCKFLLFLSFKQQCKGASDLDVCLWEQSVKANSKLGCKQVKESVNQKSCLAEVTQLIDYCAGLDDDELGFCCDYIDDPSSRIECVGEEPAKKSDTKVFDVDYWFSSMKVVCDGLVGFLPGDWSVDDWGVNNYHNGYCRFVSCLDESCDLKHDIGLFFHTFESSALMDKDWDSRVASCEERKVDKFPDQSFSCGFDRIVETQSGSYGGVPTYFSYIGIPYKNCVLGVNQHVAPSSDESNLCLLLDKAKVFVDEKRGE